MYTIYSLCPAPWGDAYRFVEAFDTEDDAKEVLAALEKVNILFHCYKIVEEEVVYTNKRLRVENKRLLKCESDLRKIHEEHMEAVKESKMCFQYIGGKLMLLKNKENDEFQNNKKLIVCPMCGDTDLSIFVAVGGFGEPEIFVPVHRCKKCNFKWTDNIADEVWSKNSILLAEEKIKWLKKKRT